MTATERERRRIEAEEDAALDFQYLLLDLMRTKGISREQLADRLGVSRARISQIFASGANPTVKQMARILDACGERLSVSTSGDDSRVLSQLIGEMEQRQTATIWIRRDEPANENTGHLGCLVAA